MNVQERDAKLQRQVEFLRAADFKADFIRNGEKSCIVYEATDADVDVLLALHSAATAFLSEYESYRTGDAVAFTPSPEVLEAFRKAVGG
jgi:hypothetical protein